MADWKENALNYFSQCYECGFDEEHIFQKGKSFCQVIGAAVYGEQADGEIDEKDEKKFGYSDKKAEHILKIQNKMYEFSPTFDIRVFKTMIYIYIDDEKQGPTIAFKFKSKNGYVFIDASCRIYSSWADFKKNNKLPECQVAYPGNGKFDVDGKGNILIDFEESPACSALKKVTKSTDILASVVGVATTAVSIVGLFTPLTAPLAIGCMIAGGSTGIYGLGRSTAQLVDRSKHEESISLADSEARLHWLNIATAPLAIAGGVATMTTQKIAATGRLLSNTAEIIVNTTIFSSFTMSSLNVINNLASLVDKAKNDELTILDVTSFVISVAFWTNSAVNLQTANGIIKTTQNEVLRNYKNGLNGPEKKMYKTMRKNMLDKNEHHDAQYPKYMHENAKAIRRMNQIQNPKEFFQNAVTANEDLKRVNQDNLLRNNKLKISLADYNCMNINDQLKIAPQKFNQMSENDKQTVLQATIDFINDKNERNFLQAIRPIKGIKFEVQRKNAFKEFSEILRSCNKNITDLKDYKCNGKKIFKDLKPHEENRIIQIKETLSQRSLNEQRVALEFAEQMKPDNLSDYASYLEYAIASFIDDIHTAKAKNNQMTKNQAKLFINTKYFDEQNNLKPSELNNLIKNYLKDLNETKSLNKALKPPFASDSAATYHCKKHGISDKTTFKEYMDKIQYVIDHATEKSVTLTQEGDASIISFRFRDEQNNVKQVLVIVRPGSKEYTMTMFDA